jgi:choline-sulfatase
VPSRVPRLLVAGALLLAACARDDREQVRVVDLVARFPVTDAARERGAIDLGTPRDDLLLRAGWQPGATLDDGTSVAWAIERKASLHFTLRAPAPRRLRVQAQQSPDDVSLGDRRTGTPVLVSLNGERLAQIRFTADAAPIEIELPARAQRAGDNVLALDHPTIQTSRSGDLRARPRNALAYDRIDVTRTDLAEPARAPALVGTADGARALLLPPGSEVRWFVRTPRGAELQLASQRDDPRMAASLQVLQVGADATLQAKATLDADAPTGAARAAARIALDAAEDDVVGLVLRASGPGAVRVVDAAIVARADSSGEATTSDGARTTGVADAAATAPDPAKTPHATERRDAATAPDVVLYVIDTLRADHLGSYGYDRPTSPRIDAFAGDALTFTHAVAQAPWTRPSVASMLTGLEPLVHGASNLRRQLRADVPTLAEILQAHGYATAAFVTNANVAGRLGFARGFETYVELPEDHARPELHVPSAELVATVQAWLARRTDTRPLFLYVHASDPHAPYTPEPAPLVRFWNGGEPAPDVRTLRAALVQPADGSPPARDRSAFPPQQLAALIAAYDAEIARSDAGFGALLDTLEARDARGKRPRALVVLTSDHGEELGDHGDLEHGHSLHDELLHVPLLIRAPDGRGAGEQRDAIAQHVDLLPTVLDVLGIEAPPGLPGLALLGDDAKTAGEREVTSHTDFGALELMSLDDMRWKTVLVLDGPRGAHGVKLYDRAEDPGEHADVAARHPLRVGRAQQALEGARQDAVRRAGNVPLVDPDTAARLRALGYAD